MHFLSRSINNRITKEFHNHAAFHASIHGQKIKPLEDLIGDQLSSNFDEKSDKFLEERALKTLQESRLKHG